MNTRKHERNGITVVEILDNDFVINDAQDFLDIISNLQTRKIILKKKNITPRFFDLKTGVAGEILQKASNYKISIGIIGDFDNVESKSLRDFIYESNKAKQILFMNNAEKILDIFCRRT